MEKSKFYIKPILLVILFVMLSLITIIWGSGTLNSKSPDKQVYATGEVAYLLKDWKSVVTSYTSDDDVDLLTFTKTDPTLSGAVLFGTDIESSSVSAVDAGSYSGDIFSQTKGITSGNADVVAYKSSDGKNVYIYSTGTIYFPIDSSSLFSADYVPEIVFESGTISTTNVINMKRMFSANNQYCSAKQFDLTSFDTSSVTDMSYMFYGSDNCSEVETIKLESFNTSKVTNMSNMFFNQLALITLDVSNFDTANVTDMSNMFGGDAYSCLTTLDVSHFETSKVTNMSRMFQGLSALTTLDVSHFDTSEVTDMSYMFDFPSLFPGYISPLSILNVSNFNTSKVTNMSGMFRCFSANLTVLDVSNFDTSNVTNMYGMFYFIEGIKQLDLSNFDLTKVTISQRMIYDCPALETIYLPKTMASINIALNTGASGSAQDYYVVSDKTTNATDSGVYVTSVNNSSENKVLQLKGTSYTAPILPVTGVDIGVGTLIASVLATLLLACGLVLVLNKKKRYK